MEENIQYVSAIGLSDKKQKRAVLLHLIGPVGQEIFDTLYDRGYNYELAIASLDSYFLSKKNFIYERYNVLSAKQNAAESIDAYDTRLRLLTTSCDYSGFEKEMMRDHVVRSCVLSRLQRRLLRKKDFSLSLSLFLSLSLSLSLALSVSLSLSLFLLKFSKQLYGQGNYQIIRHQKRKTFSNMTTVLML